MHILPAALFCAQSITLNIIIFTVIPSLIRKSLDIKKFVIFLLLSSISLIFFSFTNNFLINFTTFALLSIISFKVAFNINYKQIIIPLLYSICFYQLIINIFSSVIYNISSLKTIFSQTNYFSVVFLLLIPSLFIGTLFLLKKFNKLNIHLECVQIIKNTLYVLISAALFLLIITLTYVNTYNLYIQKIDISPILSSIGFFVNIISLFVLILLSVYLETSFDRLMIKAKNETLINDCENLGNTNKELRAIKHDFLNHLQVVTGLLQLKKYSECFNYIMNIQGLGDKSQNIKTGLISLNALLNSKQLRAKQKNIKLELDISTHLNPNSFNIQDWEITNVLGNLIDNAIYEENKVSTLNKYVKVKIDENNHFYNISVYNKNSYINSDKKKNIFISGYTTKGNDGTGMGLYIVKNIVHKYNGIIDIDSKIDTGTQFSISFPKNQSIQKESLNSESLSYPPQESFGAQNS